MGLSRKREQLNTFLSYVLGRNPYEFGLVPDENGFVKIKEFLKAVNEEEGWGHVKQQTIDELLIALPDPAIEISDNLIRAKIRARLPFPVICENPPVLLYTGFRRSAHAHVLDNGLTPYDQASYVILTSDKPLAEKIAKRRDAKPVLMTVDTREAHKLGVIFFSAGETLFLASGVPVNCFTTPPLEIREERNSDSEKSKKNAQKSPPTPGSFIPDFASTRDKGAKSARDDKLSWKNNKKKIRRQKERWRDEF